MANRIRLYTSPFTIRNQEIKTLEKLDQAIKQASRDESSDQASVSIKILDRCRSWKYGAHCSDYPLSHSRLFLPISYASGQQSEFFYARTDDLSVSTCS